MKRNKLILKGSGWLIRLSKIALALAILMILDLSMAPNIDAQRHIGGGHGFGRSGGIHMGSGFAGINGGRTLGGSFGHRGFIGRGFYMHGGVPYWRYSVMPFWGDFFWGIPAYALGFYWNGYNYYDCDGIYYRKENDKYQVVPAPVAHRVKVLPKDCLQFTMDGAPYYYYFGTFYIPKDGQYEVVPAPVGAEVNSIPNGYEKVIIDGQTYFTLNGVQYKAVIWNNEVWYRVIKSDAANVAPATPTTNKQPPVENNGTGNK